MSMLTFHYIDLFEALYNQQQSKNSEAGILDTLGEFIKFIDPESVADSMWNMLHTACRLNNFSLYTFNFNSTTVEYKTFFDSLRNLTRFKEYI